MPMHQVILIPFTCTFSGFVYLPSRDKATPWCYGNPTHRDLPALNCFLSGRHVLPVVFLATVFGQFLQNVPEQLPKAT